MLSRRGAHGRARPGDAHDAARRPRRHHRGHRAGARRRRSTSSCSPPASACARGSAPPRASGWTTSCATRCGRADVVARGPKAQSAARPPGSRSTWTAPTETNAEVLAHLAEPTASPGSASSCSATAGRRCSPTPLGALGPREVVDVPVYRWQPARGPDAGASGCSTRPRTGSSTPSRSRAPTPSTTRSSCAPIPTALAARLRDGRCWPSPSGR